MLTGGGGGGIGWGGFIGAAKLNRFGDTIKRQINIF